ncbi:hypothetical protein, partial [Parvibaculum sp.]|uniref:hypothetical protein n=1 Tax=Parvibaculum sp. TaxID=2024848 RepID=UPI0025D9BC53
MVRRGTKWAAVAVVLALCGGVAAPAVAAPWYEQNNRGAGDRGDRREPPQRQERQRTDLRHQAEQTRGQQSAQQRQASQRRQQALHER